MSAAAVSALAAGRTPAGASVLAVRGLAKSYGPNTVLSGVDLDIRSGEILAVIGENGAGKSTFMKILSGHVAPTRGTLALEGEPVAFRSPVEAERAGIVLVHQEILLADDLTVAENLFLGRELTRGGLIDDRRMRAIARDKLAAIGAAIEPDAIVGTLSLADRQLVQIARALLESHKLVIFDEPTAVLTSEEVGTLLALIRRLREAGAAVLYISHRLDEVEAIADRVTVLRDGQLVGTFEAATLGQADMARLMVGRELSTLFPPKASPASGMPLLEVEHAEVPGFIRDVSFSVARGEVLGFGGMIGAGRTELFEGILGLRAGRVAALRLEGRGLAIRHAADAIAAGIGYLTEDRKGKGLLLDETMAPNLTLSALQRFHPGIGLDRRRENAATDETIRRYDIRVRGRGVRAGQLSGGNQQKLLLAKIMLTDPSVVVIDEPTRGIDIGNKAQIYSFIQSLARAGKACIVISSEMQELIGLCDRILVIRDGCIVGELSGGAMTEANVVMLATGASERNAGRTA
ncbi:sugar ABC transporter ATP-binding protein [Aureimonas jatrophae]|uniref:Monosaccharide ABC transporter ATP-binding protein, CUT2 family n=1 Tax=Aureimonas jatrophae TaxID=1166073 RepID=A0A1H0KPF7_9HYPH|nr:sugar ABC transporter ATP-binding protein [Aureimonas jatrophae]MBB3948805.1 ribose transport system ATP-binding protein [Aureimonas jatrophae]SDO57686.1 monosaccharide ABC transporter ATP-binding protein, CUT2 family [Aureimonas jatrophae]